MMHNNYLDQVLDQRMSVRIFDPEKKMKKGSVKKSLQRAVLSANSSNLQPWEFYHITSEKMKSKVAKICLGQKAAKTAEELVVFVVRKDLWPRRAKACLDFMIAGFGKKSYHELDKEEKKKAGYYKKLIPMLYKKTWGMRSLLRQAFSFYSGLKKPFFSNVRNVDTRISCHKSVALAAQTFMLSMADLGYDTCPMEGYDEKRLKKLLALPSEADISMVIACGIRRPEGIYTERFRIPFEEVYFEH